jgi:hypothetical protein
VSVVLLVWTDGRIRSRSASGYGSRVAPPSLTWPWNSSVRLATGSSVSRSLCYLTLGIPRNNCSSGSQLYFGCRLKKNRCFEGVALQEYLRQLDWQAVGFLSGRIKVRVVRYRRKYYATNRLSLTAPEVRQLYRLRQEVEEVIRVLKSQLSLEGCPAGYTRSTEKTTPSQPQAQTHHIALCLVAYLIVERERFDQGMTWRQFKRHLILKRLQVPLPALERVRMAA